MQQCTKTDNILARRDGVKILEKDSITVTSQQAAVMLGVTQAAIRSMVLEGRLAGVQPKFRAHFRVSLVAVNELLAEQQRMTTVRLERNAVMTRKVDASHSVGSSPTVAASVKSLSPSPAMMLVKRLAKIEAKLDRLLAMWEVE
jgi:excisionase family DNA binding protein